MDFYSGNYRKAELFIRKAGEENGTFSLMGKGQQVFVTEVVNDIFHKMTVELCENTEYQLIWTNSLISQMYLCGNEDVEETGIKYLIVIMNSRKKQKFLTLPGENSSILPLM